MRDAISNFLVGLVMAALLYGGVAIYLWILIAGFFAINDLGDVVLLAVWIALGKLAWDHRK